MKFLFKFKISKSIPKKYKSFWYPFKTDSVLYHLTTKENFENIKKTGFLEPRDPSPKHWAGMKAIFMADPSDELYLETQSNVSAHVKEKGKQLLRLYIQTNNQLYKSSDPERTFQVISLQHISVADIKKIEEI